jgi:hypothetical protein
MLLTCHGLRYCLPLLYYHIYLSCVFYKVAINPVLQMRTLRLREAIQFAQGHTARKQQSQGLNQGPLWQQFWLIDPSDHKG